MEDGRWRTEDGPCTEITLYDKNYMPTNTALLKNMNYSNLRYLSYWEEVVIYVFYNLNSCKITFSSTKFMTGGNVPQYIVVNIQLIRVFLFLLFKFLYNVR